MNYTITQNNVGHISHFANPQNTAAHIDRFAYPSSKSIVTESENQTSEFFFKPDSDTRVKITWYQGEAEWFVQLQDDGTYYGRFFLAVDEQTLSPEKLCKFAMPRLIGIFKKFNDPVDRALSFHFEIIDGMHCIVLTTN